MIKVNDIKKLPRSIIAAAFKITPPAVNAWLKRGCPRNENHTFDLSEVIEWRLSELALTDNAACEVRKARNGLRLSEKKKRERHGSSG
jgi:hypothetical protein